MGYVNFQRFTEEEQSLDDVANFDPDSPLLETDDGTLISSPGEHVSVLKNTKLSKTTVILAIICVLLAIGLTVVTLVWANGNKSTKKNKRDNQSLKHFFQISDTHLDIYYSSNVTNKFNQGCRNRKHKSNDTIARSNTTAIFGRIKCDTPAYLMESMKTYITKVKQGLDNDVEFILVTGDQVGHSYQFFEVDMLDSVLWSIANSTKYISDALPGIPIYMSVGNNDLTLDYIPPFGNNSEFYKKLYNIFEPYVFPRSSNVDVLNSKEKFRETFELGGYYSMNLDGGRMLLLVLNTNYWCSTSYALSKNITTVGDLQLSWLAGQLNSAKATKQKVIVSGHIPPGMESFNGRSLWLQNYTKAYMMMMTMDFSNIIIAQIYGHVHSDNVKLQYQDDSTNMGTPAKSFLLTGPSITPVFKSNPAFRVFDYDSKEQTLSDYNQYYLDLAASNVNKKAYWFKEYSFAETYKVRPTAKGVEEIVNNFLDPSSSDWFHYSQHIKTKMGIIPYYQRYQEYCAAKYAYIEPYQKCSEEFQNIGV